MITVTESEIEWHMAMLVCAEHNKMSSTVRLSLANTIPTLNFFVLHSSEDIYISSMHV